MNRLGWFLFAAFVLLPVLSAGADDVKQTDVYARLKAQLDAVRAIDTHSHLRGPADREYLLKHEFRDEKRTNCALHQLWTTSYFTGGHRLAPWPADGKFSTWWADAQADFQNSRARSAYRCMLPIFKDLYGVDFETLTLEQAKELNERMEKNFANPNWAEEVLCRRANTEIRVVDSYWRPTDVRDHYPFTVSTFNVSLLIDGFHSSEFKGREVHSPYAFAAKHKLPVEFARRLRGRGRSDDGRGQAGRRRLSEEPQRL